MSNATVHRLDAYRDRRSYRSQVAFALAGIDGTRAQILAHLDRISKLCEADRAAVVWVDDYRPGLVHPHVVLDLLSDTPRRHFLREPLDSAWENGVPGTHDVGLAGDGSCLALAMGSDGTRSWFVVADSVNARPPISEDRREEVMFLAGEIAAIALHRDLDVNLPAPSENFREARFAGWPILKDLDGREDDEVAGWQIAQRFVVARLVRLLLDDDLVADPDRLREQAARGRTELARDVGLSVEERAAWLRTLDAMEAADLDTLAETLRDLAEMAESRGHGHTAIELHLCAFEIAAARGQVELAINAARFRARALRSLARWAESTLWYDVAISVADAASLPALSVQARAGLATNTRQRGNVPKAREQLYEALSLAESCGDAAARAAAHANLLNVEHVAGNLAEAVEHGWEAVRLQPNERDRVRVTASLAGALADYGDRTTATDAWLIVAHSSQELYYQVYAHDALAYLAAQRGDVDAFASHAERCDALGWRQGPLNARSEILYFRGISYRLLGELQTARVWLSEALEFAEEHSFNEVIFRAETALAELDEAAAAEAKPAAAAPDHVREGVKAMRRAAVVG